MLAQLLLCALIMQSAASPQSTPPPVAQATQTLPKSTDGDDPTALLKVKRIYVETFGDDIVSKELQSTLTSALVGIKRFKVTENRDRADVMLRE